MTYDNKPKRINKVMLQGKVGYCKLIDTKSGGKMFVCSMNYAANKDKETGAWENSYINIVAFDPKGPVPQDGDYVTVTGELKERKFQKKDGTWSSGVQVTASELAFKPQQNNPQAPEGYNEEIPF